jgi:hypothetical protein
METENLFANDGTHLWIKIDGTYYKRILGKGWKGLPGPPEGVNMGPMPEAQAVLFRETLADQRWRAD